MVTQNQNGSDSVVGPDSENNKLSKLDRKSEIATLIKMVHKEIERVWKDMDTKMQKTINDGFSPSQKMETAADIMEVIYMISTNVKKKLIK